MDLFVLVPIFGVVALLYTFFQSNWVNKQNAGNEKMKTISGHIADGAMAFLKAEYKILTYFVIVVAILLAVMGSSNAHSHWSIGIAFVVGAIFSALAGFIGMKIATKANVRTAEAARTSLSKALKVSFTGGSVMGMGVAGLAVLGLGALFLIIKQIFAPEAAVDSFEMERTIEILTGFSLGAESIALFARVGGGIYTKAADVGADLVGKVEAGIPEDDPRNPATIADNVGDNVGDVAGMGADLFGSYVATVLATMVLGRETVSDDAFGGFAPILLPMLIAGTGIIFSIIGTLFVRINDNEGSSTSSVQNALNLGNWGSIVITAIASYFLVTYILPEQMTLRGHEFTKMGVFGAIMVGLVVGTLMSIITEYYTAMGKRPVSSIVRQSSTGHATNIIGGLSVGMESTLLPIIVLAGGIYGSYLCAGLYGVAIAAAGMMATTAMQLAIDAFGPIADNAGGIAEMSELPKEVREKTDILDAVGNTTAATGKGFAIASAALTALALFAAFVGIAGIDGIDIYRADVLAGLFVGGMIPFIFSSLAITAVGQAAMAMVEEVRRQFREIPGILEGKAQPEYEKCVAISTDASIRKMMLPGAIAIISPLLIGFIFGPEVLGGFLAGATVSGVLMGMFQNNAGGAWDNAKKSFEKGVDINGQTYYKGSEPHKASVTGDTVGDPFKDTSGPSMNILIKLMSIVSLVIAPTLAVLHKDKIEANRKAKLESLAQASDMNLSAVSGGPQTVSSGPKEIKGHLNESGDFVYETGNIQKVKLNDGKTIAIGEESQMYQLYTAVKKKDKTALDPNTWYTIENLYFETGSSDLKPGYELTLNNLAEIINAYPDLKIKLGGYTDNSGNEESNQQLSNLRAQTAKLKLLELGVPADRIEAEGYGSQHPVCEANDTDECKAKNRRIDVRILAL
ncbi:inorganic pyrophosphatase [Chryseobacterium gallinarum]|uniref:Putative K(+)-stimulated pyrophosphate-energized sodium pump n=1 Tax=Chryseobacterium gallinarum TaxID=1324352 RepID=A0A0G3M7Y9_CHRGL|nr:sodium-translocating pyrophosphatase [Chryseobacterium gallinarum]AKK74078.1 inorganic pyrophosphatase [Chryseobacterium gallinarum]MCL8537892.1 sodium-translocating pyrophosphatase [Chryseobacterium gallinarum]